ncbi:hypothetical protein MY4824_000748 [Beauveria thailandica]
MNILTNVMMLALPIPMIQKLKLGKHDKAMLFGLFLLGGFVTITSILRTTSVQHPLKNRMDITFGFITRGIWTLIEANLGTIIPCLVVLRQELGVVSRQSPTRRSRAAQSGRDDEKGFALSDLSTRQAGGLWRGSNLAQQTRLRRVASNYSIKSCSPGGIGHAIATEFQKNGYHVIATARRAEVLEELRKTGMSVVSLDVCDKASIHRCKEEVAQITAGKLDILVNNAGVNHTIPATDIDIDDVKQTFNANVFGPMLMCQAFVPLLIPARGLIINISSVSAIVPYLFASVYSSTKAALDGYSRTLRLELKPFHVRVMVAMTGTVKSNITSHFVRELPGSSLYQPVRDMYDDRIHFSQRNSPMPADVYAKKLVAAALKGEGWLGGLFGRTPDWFWAGGLANVAWFGQTFFPRRFAEFLTAITFKISKMAYIIAEARAKRN